MKTKSITVAVHIQMDIDSRLDVIEQVQTTLVAMNEMVRSSGLEGEPQIFVNNIDQSDLIDSDTDFDIDDEVEVPDPIEGDIHNHSFVGTIKDIFGDIATVEDGDGDCFDIEIDRLSKA